MTCTPVPIRRCTPPHEVRDRAKLNKIIKSMKRHRGWEGRPLLGVEKPNGDVLLLTGSHRYAAAVSLQFPEVPVHIVPLDKSFTLRGRRLYWHGEEMVDDDQLLIALTSLGKADALGLLEWEIVKRIKPKHHRYG